MKGRLLDLSFTLNGKQRLVIELDDDFRQDFAALEDHDVRVEIKKWRKKRSLDANAYAWVLIEKIAQATGVPKTEVYRKVIREIGGVSEIVCVRTEAVDKFREGWEAHGLGWQTDVMPSKIEGCTNVVLYYGSSTYDTKQMSALIDSLVQEAQALGIETLPPHEIARLNSLWGERNG
jgi:hypothetical protein